MLLLSGGAWICFLGAKSCFWLHLKTVHHYATTQILRITLCALANDPRAKIPPAVLESLWHLKSAYSSTSEPTEDIIKGMGRHECFAVYVMQDNLWTTFRERTGIHCMQLSVHEYESITNHRRSRTLVTSNWSGLSGSMCVLELYFATISWTVWLSVQSDHQVGYQPPSSRSWVFLMWGKREKWTQVLKRSLTFLLTLCWRKESLC